MPFDAAHPRVETAFAAVRREAFLGPGPWPILPAWSARRIIVAGALHVAFRRSDQAHALPPLPSPSIRSSAGGRERWIRLREDGVGIAQRKSPDELVAQRMIARRRRAQNELVAQATGNVDRCRLGIEKIYTSEARVVEMRDL